jgi:ABC-2 type transport system ATP-binding protein
MLQPRTNARPVAVLDAVTKRYGATVALDAVTLEVRPGQVTALLGANGAGKTTTVRLIQGITRPSAGRVTVGGASPLDWQTRRRTGVMLQVSGVPGTLTVREHVRLFSAYYAAPLPLGDVLARAGLEALASRPFAKLSGGQQQRLMFALAICGNPDLLCLDEPTVGLDVEARRRFWEEIRRLRDNRRAILLTTHYLEEADALADRVVVLAAGRLVADGTPAALKARTFARRLRCRTRLSADEVSALPGVVSVASDRGAVVAVTSHAEHTARALLARDATLSDLEIATPRLEDAFLALTAADATTVGAHGVVPC